MRIQKVRGQGHDHYVVFSLRMALMFCETVLITTAARDNYRGRGSIMIEPARSRVSKLLVLIPINGILFKEMRKALRNVNVCV